MRDENEMRGYQMFGDAHSCSGCQRKRFGY